MSTPKAILVAAPGQKARMGEIEVMVLEVRIFSHYCIKYSVAWISSGVRYEQVIDQFELSHDDVRALDVGFRS